MTIIMETTEKKRWFTVTYVEKETVFYQAFWTHQVEKNFLEDNLRTENKAHTEREREKYIATSVYQLSCPKCNKKSVG